MPTARVAVEKKRPLLRRVPRSLMVTLIGIGLSAWLLPAFTRQWDDRQKAHDLKTALSVDVNAAARAFVDSQAMVWARTASPGRPAPRAGTIPAPERAWAIATYELGPRFGALGDSALVTFDDFSVLMQRELARAAGTRRVVTILGGGWLGLSDGTADQARDAVRAMSNCPDGRLEICFRRAEGSLSTLWSLVMSRIQTAHVAGYSTSTRDLIHDLNP